MKKLFVENTFKKDLKKLKKRKCSLESVEKYIDWLCQDKKLPARSRPHKLAGQYIGLWECHIENDWLLIYHVTEDTITLIRTGSHSDLFD